MLKRVGSALPLALGLSVLGALCWQFGLGALAAALGRLSPAYLLAYLAAGTAVVLGYAARWRLVTRALGAHVGLPQLLSARLAGDAVGALVPSGKLAGEPVRVALLYAGGHAGTRASAGVTIDRLLEIIGNMLCFVAYVSVFSLTHTLASSQRAACILIATMLALLVALAIPLVMWWRGLRPLAPLYGARARRLVPQFAHWLPALRRTEDHLLRFFRQHPVTFVWGLLGSLLIEVVVIGEYHCLLATFAIDVDLPTLLLVLLGSGLARAVPTPAGLGALEASQVGVLTFAAGHPETGFVVGMVLRMHETLWMALGLLALSVQGGSLARLRMAALPEHVRR